ncbi:TRAP transporter small permease [Paraglaciecola aquimarina]|uniref:TRAP transporter small permease protein n=1 Tax=Paraglaciecola algarum TaxID=3050085 RepID=A0ABS9D2G4_9ALTE|nr:TRAP transporter small permease [Paraglaciecola sp. G1-23]MCF2946819.1 TRAP transporter small permease [Paraglaciecola sp. G1-23]
MTDYKTSDNAGNTDEVDALNFDIEDDEPFAYADFRFEDWVAFVLFWLLAITLFSQFLSRYVFSSPLGWTEELARYQLVALGFIGACMGVRKNTHIFVSLFHRWMPQSLSTNIYRFIALCNLVFLCTLAYFAWQIIPLLEIHKMASLDVSVSVLYSVVFGGLLLMIFRGVQHLISVLTSTPFTHSASDDSTQNSLD